MSAITDAEPVTIPLAIEDHKAGCPGSRVESYEATRPGAEGQPNRTVTVTRCGDCGGHRVRDADIATVIRALRKKGITDGRKQRRDAGTGQQPESPELTVNDTKSGDWEDNPIE